MSSRFPHPWESSLAFRPFAARFLITPSSNQRARQIPSGRAIPVRFLCFSMFFHSVFSNQIMISNQNFRPFAAFFWFLSLFFVSSTVLDALPTAEVCGEPGRNRARLHLDPVERWGGRVGQDHRPEIPTGPFGAFWCPFLWQQPRQKKKKNDRVCFSNGFWWWKISRSFGGLVALLLSYVCEYVFRCLQNVVHKGWAENFTDAWWTKKEQLVGRQAVGTTSWTFNNGAHFLNFASDV